MVSAVVNGGIFAICHDQSMIRRVQAFVPAVDEAFRLESRSARCLALTLELVQEPEAVEVRQRGKRALDRRDDTRILADDDIVAEPADDDVAILLIGRQAADAGRIGAGPAADEDLRRVGDNRLRLVVIGVRRVRGAGAAERGLAGRDEAERDRSGGEIV